MHIPPKPFRDREMKMSTERAARKQKAHNQGTAAELQGGPGLGSYKRCLPILCSPLT